MKRVDKSTTQGAIGGKRFSELKAPRKRDALEVQGLHGKRGGGNRGFRAHAGGASVKKEKTPSEGHGCPRHGSQADLGSATSSLKHLSPTAGPRNHSHDRKCWSQPFPRLQVLHNPIPPPRESPRGSRRGPLMLSRRVQLAEGLQGGREARACLTLCLGAATSDPRRVWCDPHRRKRKGAREDCMHPWRRDPAG